MGCTATKQTKKSHRENRLSLPDEHNDMPKQRLLTPDQKAEEKKKKPPPPLDKQKLVDLCSLDNQTIFRNKKFSSDYFITKETITRQGQNGQFFIVEHKITGLKRIAKITNNIINENQINEYVSYLQTIKKLDHPNLIKLYDFYYDEKHIYLVEEYCEGGDLFERMSIEMKSKEKVHVAFVFQQVLSAISYLHEQNIIHKNIKTSNIVAAQKYKLLVKLVGYEDIYNLFQDNGSDISYSAPETFHANYKWSKSADIWSAGVVLFELFFGQHPFKSKNNKAETISNIKHKQDFDFSEINQDAAQLLQEMMDRDHKQRPTAKNCLKFKYFKTIRRSSMKIASTLLKLKEFRRRNELRVILLSLMIEYLLPKEERDKIAETFYKIDFNNNGKISKSELLQQYLTDQVEPSSARKQVDSIFEQLDVNGSEYLEFNEFLIASCNKETLLTQENLQIFFNKLDKDHSQQISASELKVFFYNSKLSQQEWQQVMSLGDKDDNNKMSFKEFVTLLKE